MGTANIKHTKICAFCKHWYDPTNSAIKPKAPVAGIWEYDERARNKCLKLGVDIWSFHSCGQFLRKL